MTILCNIKKHVLIGSLDCLCLLRLARVITLVLVLRHSMEKFSKSVIHRLIHSSMISFVLFSRKLYSFDLCLALFRGNL